MILSNIAISSVGNAYTTVARNLKWENVAGTVSLEITTYIVQAGN